MTEYFKHSERRFLVPHVYRAVVEAQLKLALPTGREYEVETVYVDTPERSWSLMSDSTLPKMRVRKYGSGDMYFEKKLHSESDTSKERVPVSAIPAGLVSIGITKYTRTEHSLRFVTKAQVPSGDSGPHEIRITVDRDIHIDGVAFDMLVIEIKGELLKTFRFLLPFEDRKFSKYKALSGRWKDEQSYT